MMAVAASTRTIHRAALLQRVTLAHGNTGRWLSTGADLADSRPDFSDTSVAYKTKTTSELLRAFLVFKLFQYDTIVTNSYKVSATKQMYNVEYWLVISLTNI